MLAGLFPNVAFMRGSTMVTVVRFVSFRFVSLVKIGRGKEKRDGGQFEHLVKGGANSKQD
jgi:hypothetical protein